MCILLRVLCGNKRYLIVYETDVKIHPKCFQSVLYSVVYEFVSLDMMQYTHILLVVTSIYIHRKIIAVVLFHLIAVTNRELRIHYFQLLVCYVWYITYA